MRVLQKIMKQEGHDYQMYKLFYSFEDVDLTGLLS